MKKKSFIVLVLLLIIPIILPAHGIEVKVSYDSQFVELTCLYSGGVPVRDGSVTVQLSGVEEVFQRGFTDQNGTFTFSPDRAGEWTVRVDDGMGHGKRQKIHIGASFLGPAADRATEKIVKEPMPDDKQDLVSADTEDNGIPFSAVPVWLKLLLGVSLILNISFFMSLWSRRKKNET